MTFPATCRLVRRVSLPSIYATLTLASATCLALSLTLAQPAYAEAALGSAAQLPAAQTLTTYTNLLQNVSIAQEGLPERFETAEAAQSCLNSQQNWLGRLAVIRLALRTLDPEAQKAFIEALKLVHQDAKTDMLSAINFGLADFIANDNKANLYFFRKATESPEYENDAVLNLIYAMAQVHVDANLEKAPENEMTLRKLDVILRLREAVSQDAAKHTEGFWPVFQQVRTRLLQNPLYAQDLSDDFSVRYVPIGQSPFSMPPQNATLPCLSNCDEKPQVTPQPPTTEPTASAALLAITDDTAPMQATGPALPPANAIALNQPGTPVAVSTRPLPLGMGKAHQVRFYMPATGTSTALLDGVVYDETNQPLALLPRVKSANVVEDIDGDGRFEIVIRQYEQNPGRPILVYRFTPEDQRYHLDTHIERLFE
ncbi:MAG: hypothetical protein VKJ06_07545 [Vampirovibrionales bacterium]|nr:hypothetical protein [Vampirovibrionales bacterium]